MRNTITPRTTGPTERPFCWTGPCTTLHPRDRAGRSTPRTAHQGTQHHHQQRHHRSIRVKPETGQLPVTGKTTRRVCSSEHVHTYAPASVGRGQQDGFSAEDTQSRPPPTHQQVAHRAVPSWTSLSLGPPTGAEPLATMTRLGSARPSSHSSGSPATTLLPRKAVSQHKRQLAHHPEPPAYLVLGVRRPCPRDVPVKFCFGHLEALRGYHCDDEEGERGLRRVGQGGWKWRKKGAGRVGCG